LERTKSSWEQLDIFKLCRTLVNILTKQLEKGNLSPQFLKRKIRPFISPVEAGHQWEVVVKRKLLVGKVLQKDMGGI
jgi:hypothetical protein